MNVTGYQVGDRVRTTEELTLTTGDVVPVGAEGVIEDEVNGFFLFVRLDDHTNPYDGFLADESHRGTWPLTPMGTELVGERG